MKRYGIWKYFLILVVLGFGIVYSLPNLYAPDPAVQVSYTSSSQTADKFLEDRILNIIQESNLYTQIELEKDYVIDDAKETSELAERSDKQQDIYLVPAFTGLGAPYWDPDCRGAIFGITRDTGREELARAALEAVCYQTRDLLEAMKRDWVIDSEIKTTLRVDGGVAANNWAMQFLADILMSNVDRPVNLETTALGAAYLSGLHMEALPPPEEFETRWARERCFKPAMSPADCDRKYKGWSDAVQRTLINNVTAFDRNH